MTQLPRHRAAARCTLQVINCGNRATRAVVTITRVFGRVSVVGLLVIHNRMLRPVITLNCRKLTRAFFLLALWGGICYSTTDGDE